jgi:hypothetical protein
MRASEIFTDTLFHRSASPIRGGYISISAVLVGLLLVQILIMFALEGRGPNALHSPFLDFWPVAKITWSQSLGSTLSEWFSRPLLEILSLDADSGRTAWTLNYYWPSVFAHVVVASLSVRYWRRTARHPATRATVPLIGAGLAPLVGTAYLSISAHCEGATWLPIVVMNAWQGSAIEVSFMLQRLAIDMPLVIMGVQGGLVALGLFLYYRLWRTTRP